MGTMIGLVLVSAALSCYWLRCRIQTSLPPGPKPWPIVGNILDMPHSSAWLTFTEWKERYGKIVFVRLFRTPIIIINSYSVAKLLLERKSKVFSGRPHLTMAVDLAHLDWGMTLSQNNSWHRYVRRIFESHLRPSLVHNFAAQQQRSAVLLLRDLTIQSDGLRTLVRSAVGSSLLEIVHGQHPRDITEKRIQSADRVAIDFTNAIEPGRWIVDTIPFLRFIPEWTPGVQFKKLAREYRERSRVLIEEPFAEIKAELARGVAKPCLTVTLIEENKDNDSQFERAAKEVTAVAYVAGTDTTTSTLCSFIMEMMLNPSAQIRAREELDTVCPDRLPKAEERPFLVQVEAILRETLRCHPALPQGVPHRLDEDCKFEGWTLPKDAVVIPNIWGMLRDEELYSDPHAFKPARFIRDGKIDPSVQDPRDMFFGFGKRICPGRGLADAEMFLIIANILKVFKIEYPLDDLGNPYVPDIHFETGMPSAPCTFPCRFVPRNSSSCDLIKNALDHL